MKSEIKRVFFKQINKNNFKSFTLSDVLLALIIIGVIAALSIPVILANYQKHATISRLKKVYSTFAQTTYKSVSDNGPVDTWELSGSNNFNASKTASETYLIPYLHILKKCDNNNSDECKFPIIGLNGSDVSSSKSPSNTSYRFYLSDGTFISTYALKDSSRNRLIITFDINGKQRPNKMGRDIFRLEYYFGATGNYADLNGKFVPTYVKQSRSNLLSNANDRCNKRQNGDACFALIYKDGWQIKNDYPW